MGTVLIHSGMPKTGSSSIQRWLQDNAPALRADLGVQVVTDAQAPAAGPISIEPFQSGAGVVSTGFVLRYGPLLADPGSLPRRQQLVDRFVGELGEAADRHGTVLLTSEALHGALAPPDDVLVVRLADLATRHTVRVVHYVRPQDTALEARWRQWGYQAPTAPSAWVAADAARLRYADACEELDRRAPSISFEPRPFRADLLRDGDVVADFAAWLGAAPPDVPLSENRGLPLDLAILLRGAPPQVVAGAASVDGGARQLKLALLARQWAVEASPAVERSRQVLRAFAHRELEPGNRRLIERRGWPTASFIEPPAEGAEADLGLLDELWEPDVPPAALSYLHRALASVLDAPAAAHDRGSG